MSLNIGIIGTAGRKEDSKHLNPELYSKMIKVVQKIIYSLSHAYPIRLVSGGAAYADHIAVRLFDPKWNKLRLHLPANFDLRANRFDEITTPYYSDAGAIANHYHRAFSQKCHLFSLLEISEAINKGAEAIVTKGFFQRNTKVAKDSDILIALTFGEKNKVKDGGTADTCRKYLSLGKIKLLHIDLHNMSVWENGIV